MEEEGGESGRDGGEGKKHRHFFFPTSSSDYFLIAIKVVCIALKLIPIS